MPPSQEKDVRGEGVNFLQAPTSFPQAPSYFKYSQKDVEGGGPDIQDLGHPPGFPLKKGDKKALLRALVLSVLGSMGARGGQNGLK